MVYHSNKSMGGGTGYVCMSIPTRASSAIPLDNKFNKQTFTLKQCVVFDQPSKFSDTLNDTSSSILQYSNNHRVVTKRLAIFQIATLEDFAIAPL